MTDMDPKIAEVLARIAECTDEELAEFVDVVRGEIDAAAEAKDVALLTELAEGLEAVKAEQTSREETAAAAEQAIADIMAKVNAPADEVEETVETTTEEPVVEVTTEEETAAAAVEPIAASTKPLPSISELAARRPRKAAPRVEVINEPVRITAGADLAGHSAGAPLKREDIPVAMLSRWRSLRHAKASSGPVFYPVAQVSADIESSRTLSANDAWGNQAKIDAVTSPEALVASGGFCAPTEARYEVFGMGSIARPIKDGLVRFGGDRGGVRFIAPSTLTDFDTATDVYTEQNDIDAVTKDSRTLTCGVETTVITQAITHIQKIGNFNDRTHPEAVKAALRLGEVNWARLAEKTLFDAMDTASTATSATTEYLGATRDILHALGRAAVAYRSRHRLDRTTVLRWVAPDWIPDGMRTDLSQQFAGDNAFAKADAEILGFFTANHISPIWEMDNDPYGAQGAVPLLPFKTSFESLLFAEGTFGFIDGGVLDLGVVRDGTLNLTNDFQFFYESFENVAKFGTESIKLTMDVCFNGLSAGSDDTPRACSGGGS